MICAGALSTSHVEGVQVAVCSRYVTQGLDAYVTSDMSVRDVRHRCASLRIDVVTPMSNGRHTDE